MLHLPGQLAAYLALPLEPLGLDLAALPRRPARRRSSACSTSSSSKGTTRPDLPGVFLGHARVASVGVAVNRWIAYHGLTLNVGPFLEPFELLLDEPGIGPFPLRQTSMESRRQRPTPMPKVREALIRQLEAVFGLERHHVYTHHPLIRRKVCAHVYAPSPG